eukprot:CAMPEP_0197630056 /NCGR_PEP_ID=MMETSP1338-20131121/7671_1 /TAXON_ID=43686 ORGANISM="Pelagodinium beii, Strain RCC1491" /NCGR_SAMPLE_ID=MMETSP1338 /ASSEMBLY_ACC=CAM_ASM_000754 /LENGTH=132 /DNA_ID=CAMNT_0043201193 /DNA_START=48 /DNA_END=446 /DNA_ORIENTATION=+
MADAAAAKLREFIALAKLRMFNHAEKGEILEFNIQLELVEDANVKDDYGRSPLHIAALMGHPEIAKSLLENGDCNPNILDMHGRTPLAVALQHVDGELASTTEGKLEVAKLLRENKGKEQASYTKVYPSGSI